MINISYIEYSDILKENMWYTAEPFYQNIDMEFENLVEFVKSDYRQISPYFYKHRQKNKLGWCNSRQNLLILDIDDGMSINEVCTILDGYSYIIYTTKSHQKEKQGKVCDRFRLIIPADNIPRDEDVYFVMLRLLRFKFKSDEQTETKAAGFLCNEDAHVIIKNGYKIFDCKHYAEKSETIVALEAKIKLLESEERTKKRNEYQSKGNYVLSAQELKDSIDLETMVEIIDTLGFEINHSNMFRLRDNERTASTKIYSNGIYDFGGRGSLDIFDLTMEVLNISFQDSLDYISKFIRR